MRRLVKVLGSAIVVLLALAIVLVGVVTMTEYRPRATETLDITGKGIFAAPEPGDEITLLTFNIGYGGLGEGQDFFMDGGEMVRPPDEATVRRNLDGIEAFLKENPADVYFLQEVDSDSRRSYGINEVAEIEQLLDGSSAYAMNFKSIFTPYPWPPIGKVTSGLVTSTGFDVSEATRVALPVPFKWPVRIFNLKRCLLVERVPVEGGKDLVLVNLHLEAYEDGDGRARQMAELVRLLQNEYAKGNYVVAGGDFNQSFPGVDYPKVSSNWVPGQFDSAVFAAGWTVAHDASAPTSRLNDAPWDGDNQLYGIDGFVTSPNVEVISTETIDEDFRFSDHNPVKMTITLKG
ncbi:MAG: endonuclease/exonuclease/phosphatase family protein [Bifidobacteriaceae bacterium]|jgi:endonuclease/exonuclease/phosphatase family metal-dependent hydrolase|nr:endonuclease/exonuclease/phosphatase family protein [Bifidobacteriaceae bacterium]